MIQITDVTKSFRGTEVLGGITAEWSGGECVALLGPNGAGKTTLLQIISGAIHPSEGKVFVEGVSMEDCPQKAKAFLGVAPQAVGYFPFLTGKENLQFMAQLRGLDEASGRKQQEQLLRRFDLDHAGDRVAKEYSEGMRQKLNIAMAFIGHPPNLILDESLNGLDPKGLASARTLVRERLDEGALVLMTSHILPLVNDLASRVVLLHEGRIQEDLQGEELEQAKSGNGGLEGCYLRWTDATGAAHDH